MKPFWALLLLGGSSVWAQDKTGLHARELFYSPAPQASQTPSQPSQPQATPVKPTKAPDKVVADKAALKPAAKVDEKNQKPATPATGSTLAVNVPLGMRYSVLKRNASGAFDEVDADTNFRSGDRIRVKVDSNNTGYLYIVAQGSSGAWQLLFPSQEVAGGSNLIQPGESRTVPSGDRGQWAFDDRGGVEKLFVVLTRQPESDLDKLIYSFSGVQNGPGASRTLLAKASVSNDVVSRLRQQVSSRDLVFEKVDSDNGPIIEKAAYVVNASSAPDSRLVVDVSLNHK
jgi:hypothetical protein